MIEHMLYGEDNKISRNKDILTSAPASLLPPSPAQASGIRTLPTRAAYADNCMCVYTYINFLYIAYAYRYIKHSKYLCHHVIPQPSLCPAS